MKYLQIPGADFSANAIIDNDGLDYNWVAGFVDANNALTTNPAAIVARSIVADRPLRVRTLASDCGFAVLNVGTKKWNNGAASASWIYDETEVYIAEGTTFTVQCRYAPVDGQNIDVDTPYKQSRLVQNIIISDCANLSGTLNWVSGFVDSNNTLTVNSAAITTRSNVAAKSLKIRTVDPTCGFAVLNVGTKKWNNNASSASWIYDSTVVSIEAGVTYTIQCRYSNTPAIDVETPFAESKLARNIFVVED